MCQSSLGRPSLFRPILEGLTNLKIERLRKFSKRCYISGHAIQLLKELENSETATFWLQSIFKCVKNKWWSCAKNWSLNSFLWPKSKISITTAFLVSQTFMKDSWELSLNQEKHFQNKQGLNKYSRWIEFDKVLISLNYKNYNNGLNPSIGLS